MNLPTTLNAPKMLALRIRILSVIFPKFTDIIMIHLKLTVNPTNQLIFLKRR
jgi:hypothetical protein